MTYTKQPGAAPGITAALEATLVQHGLAGEGGLAADVAPPLEAAGALVRLETGVDVWVSCVVYDRPETPQVDFLTAAIAYRSGMPWKKPNGQYVASVFWHGLWPDVLAALSIGTTRKALMMVALGEPQAQVAVVNPPAGSPTTRDAIPFSDAAARSIRTAITAANEIAAPTADVL